MDKDNDYAKKITTGLILIILLVLTFFLLKPIIMAIILGIILAFIFSPIYDFIFKYLKRKNITALLMCLLLIALIVIPLWYVFPVAIDQSIKFYMNSQDLDFVTPLRTIFPSFFESDEFSNEIGLAIHSFVTKTTSSLMNSMSNIILNFPTLFLRLLVVFFTFFFVLRDKEEMIEYIKTLLPFSKEVEKRLFKSSKDLTISILFGQIVLGIVQGITAGIGFFIFGVPNALLLTLLAALAGMFPIVGTTIVWIPVAIYLLIAGNTVSALGVVMFGLISSVIEAFFKPIFISRRAKMNSSLILFGMVGGILLFGLLGIILGPLILAYLFIVIEAYRDKKLPDAVIKSPEKE
ncbi:MAG: AI-2E family transporter [Candidatus Pacearchaeota archaeon]|nr:AI-2E family transporter [Candidatus Pacearchaeota archaeon]